MGKKKDKVKVSFVGENSQGVTGSCTLIEYKELKILIECGLYQSNNMKKDYEVNSRKFKFKAREIDYVFTGHEHIDHIGLLPRLYEEGCTANTFATNECLPFIEPLLRDSAYIVGNDSVTLSRTTGKTVKPIYEEESVDKVLGHLRGCEYNNLYVLDDRVSFEFIPSGHIVGSAQLVLYIKEDSGHIQKILYTSDLGNVKLDKPFVEPFQKVTKANIVIGETTYADQKRFVKKKDRDKDIEKIRTVIDTTCIDRKSKVLIPCFSLDRTQFMLKVIYDLFGEDENFDIPIVVDSPLAVKMTNVYREVLKDEDKELIEKICNWKNVRFVKDADESKALVADNSPKVIISASGMMTAGRVVHHARNVLPDSNAMILFCGFSAENSLASRIKHGNYQKTVNINRRPVKNKCGIMDLKSFSSHMQYDDLLAYYSQINCQAIYLVHGEQNAKVKFKEVLEEKLRSEGKTTNVVAVNRGTSANL